MNEFLTIVIPCKNEEVNIALILHDIHRQSDIQDVEILIADASSTDTTLSVIEQMKRMYNLNIRVIEGGLPSVGRNNGAREAKTPYILFMDSDIRLRDHRLIFDTLTHIICGKYWMATTNTYCDSTSKMSQLIYWVSSKLQSLSKYLWYPYATGMYMMVRKDTFDGFDENVIYAEDYFLSKKIPRRKFYMHDSAIYTSDRRLQKMGTFGMIKLFVKTIINTWNYKFFLNDHSYWK